jgi:hypothetical protein
MHEHLDGGLRPQTIVELAETVGYHGLQTREADALDDWSCGGSADSGSLERYLETFDQTLVVMQTVDGLHRIASECVQNLAADVWSMPKRVMPPRGPRSPNSSFAIETTGPGFDIAGTEEGFP